MTLYCGDMLTMLDELDVNSVHAVVTVLESEVNPIPFGPLVAGMTEGDDIIKCVGIVTIGKPTDWLDVVNVRRAMRRVHFLTTSAAGVIIPDACSTAHGSPVWTVVRGMPTAPGGVAAALTAFVGALMRTETEPTPRTNLSAWDSDGSATRLTSKDNGRFPQSSPTTRLATLAPRFSASARYVVRLGDNTLDNAKRPTFIQARQRTYNCILCARYLRRWPLKAAITDSTPKLLRCASVLTTHLVRTCAAARRLTAMLQSRWIGLVFHPTDRAYTLNCIHKGIIA